MRGGAEDIRASVQSLSRPDQFVTLEGHVSEESTAELAVALAMESFGSLDILVNSAGTTMNKP